MNTKRIYDLKGNPPDKQINRLIAQMPKITDETIFITDLEILIKLVPLEAFKHKLKCQLSGDENNWRITLIPKI